MDQQPLHDKIARLSFLSFYLFLDIYVSCVHIFDVVQDIGPLVSLDFLIILPLGLVFEILIKKGISTLTHTILHT